MTINWVTWDCHVARIELKALALHVGQQSLPFIRRQIREIESFAGIFRAAAVSTCVVLHRSTLHCLNRRLGLCGIRVRSQCDGAVDQHPLKCIDLGPVQFRERITAMHRSRSSSERSED